MIPPKSGAKLTISALGARNFFDPERTNGLRIRTEDDVITFRSTVATNGAAVVPIEHRKRGGMAALIDTSGSHAPNLFQLFRKAGFKPTEPFFILNKARGGWVGIEHHRSPNPPITKPHLRVWMSDVKPGRKAAVAIEEDSLDWRQIRKTLTDAKTLISQRGRMTAEKEQAQKTWDQFEKLIDSFLPERDALRDAQDEREIAIAERDQAIIERDRALEEAESLQTLLDNIPPATGRPSRLHRPETDGLDEAEAERDRALAEEEFVEAEPETKEPVIAASDENEIDEEGIEEGEEGIEEGDEGEEGTTSKAEHSDQPTDSHFGRYQD